MNIQKTDDKGFRSIFRESVLRLVRRPLYWVGFFVLPLFIFFFMASLMSSGLPQKVPAAMVDRDGSSLSREITQNLGGMQMVDLKYTCNSYTQARHKMQEGEIFGFFLIPEDFETDLLSGRKPVLTFYTNMTYFVPAALLFRTFKSTAVFTKASVAINVIEAVGVDPSDPMSLLQPVNISARAIGNPELNYAIYLNNSFLPCVLQLMIMLLTCYSLGEEIKRGTSVRLLRMADGSIVKAVFAKLLPQTIVWVILAIFLESWLYGWNGYPMHGSWFWFTLSELMYVLACQGMGLFIFSVLPNMRLSLSVSALLGILSFSIAAFSFPVESMYGSIGIFSYIVPIRYNFLIYIDQALNGIPVYYSRWWYVAYIIFMVIPFTMLWKLKKAYEHPVYAP